MSIAEFLEAIWKDKDKAALGCLMSLAVFFLLLCLLTLVILPLAIYKGVTALLVRKGDEHAP
jgi:hypothetical protein